MIDIDLNYDFYTVRAWKKYWMVKCHVFLISQVFSFSILSAYHSGKSKMRTHARNGIVINLNVQHSFWIGRK